MFSFAQVRQFSSHVEYNHLLFLSPWVDNLALPREKRVLMVNDSSYNFYSLNRVFEGKMSLGRASLGSDVLNTSRDNFVI